MTSAPPSISYLSRNAYFNLRSGTPLAPDIQAAPEAGRALAHARQPPAPPALAAIDDIRIEPDSIIADPNGEKSFGKCNLDFDRRGGGVPERNARGFTRDTEHLVAHCLGEVSFFAFDDDTERG